MKNIAVSILYMVVGLAFILVAYTFVAYPVMSLLGGLVANSNDVHVIALYTNEMFILAAVGLIFAVSLVVWVVIRLAKREVFDLD